ncbi:hypothetical protein BSR29_05325 [Boudabousia liubingyangii]|uniref:Permease n=2 Tax=Boudabousia liubingyangii TaxID=1921764 RepID=A0A1Q5PLY4_9ACTO|nr:hypothetical protein BSR29_05325 [Boudabousia liubingyangii]
MDRIPSGVMVLIIVGSVALLLTIQSLQGVLLPTGGRLQAWQAVVVSIVFQATPFLVLGTLISGALTALLPGNLLGKLTPRQPLLSVPAAAGASMLLPACECASVPVAQSLMRRGVPAAAALTFLLASPAINPVVLISTAVAFNGNPMMVWARFTASIIAAILTGWIWLAFGPADLLKLKGGHNHQHGQKLEDFRATVVHDFLQAGGFLVLGAMIAAAIKVTISRNTFDQLAAYPAAVIALMAGMAIVMSLCSEADAFVAAAFTTISPTGQLVFMVVGPMIDIKLFAMQSGAFGWKFAVRFMTLTLVMCILSAASIGNLFFG